LLASREIEKAKAAILSVTAEKPSVFEKLYGKPQAKGSLLAFASADFGDVSIPNPAKASAMGNAAPYDRATAVYDISARTVYLPDGHPAGSPFRARRKLDDPRYVHVRMHGATPPHVYSWSRARRWFHGVPALRLKPVGGEEAIFGRTGLLAHTYMLAQRRFQRLCLVQGLLRVPDAYRNRGIKRLAASRAWSDGATGDVPNRQRKSMLRRMIPRGVPSSSMSWNFRAARSSILSRSLRNCCSRWPGAVRVAFSRSSIAAVLIAQDTSSGRPSSRTARPCGRTRRFGMILLSAPSGCSCRRTSSAHDSIFAFRNHRIELRYLAQAIGLGFVRTRDERSLTLVLVPSRFQRRDEATLRF